MARIPRPDHAEFKPVNFAKAARDKLAKLRQTGSVKAYTALFTSIILEIGQISEEEQFDRYVRGLKDRTRQEVELREVATLEEAMRIADRFDTILYHSTYKRSTSPARHQGASRSVQSSKNDNLGPTPMDLDAIKKVKLTDEERERLKKIRACFYCRQEGHMAIHCPQKKKDKRNTSNDASLNIINKNNEQANVLKVKKLTDDAKVPQQQSAGAIGLDLHANETQVI